MATHSTAVKSSIGTTVRTALNAGSGALQAVEFRTAGDVAMASVPLATTPWGAPNGSGVIAAAGLPQTATVTLAGTNNCTKAVVKDKDGSVCLNCTVATSAADIIFDVVSWVLNATVTLSSLTYGAA